MLKLIKDYKGSLIVNGKHYSTVKDALNEFKGYTGPIEVVIGSDKVTQTEPTKKKKVSLYAWIR